MVRRSRTDYRRNKNPDEVLESVAATLGSAENPDGSVFAMPIEGKDGAGDDVTGNPVLIAGVDGEGKVRLVTIGSDGSLPIIGAPNIQLGGSTRALDAASAAADANTGERVAALHPYLYNGTSFDRQRGTNGAAHTKDAGPAWTPSQTSTDSAELTAATNVSPAPTVLQHIVADDIVISSDTELSIKFGYYDGDGFIPLTPSIYLAANSTTQITLRDGLRVPMADKELQAQASIAGNVGILVLSHSEA